MTDGLADRQAGFSFHRQPPDPAHRRHRHLQLLISSSQILCSSKCLISGRVNPPGSNGQQCSNQPLTSHSPTVSDQVLNVRSRHGNRGCRCDGSLREPVEGAESLGDEVEESSAGVSPVLPVGGLVLRHRDRELDYSTSDLLGEPRCKKCTFIDKATYEQLTPHNRLNHIIAASCKSVLFPVDMCSRQTVKNPLSKGPEVDSDTYKEVGTCNKMNLTGLKFSKCFR